MNIGEPLSLNTNNDSLDRFLIRLTLHRPVARPGAPIDRLEGFRPGGHSMYQRVMVAVLCGRTSIPAWTYWMAPH